MTYLHRGEFTSSSAQLGAAAVGRYRSGDDCLAYLYDVLVHSHRMESSQQAIALLLDAGLSYFGADHAMICQPISGSVFEVLSSASGDDDAYYPGQHIGTEYSLLGRVGEPLLIPDVQAARIFVSPSSYGGERFRSYLGIGLDSPDGPDLTLCILSARPKPMFSDGDREILQRLGEGIAFIVGLQRVSPQARGEERSILASGSLHSLEEYLEKASIPKLCGIPARVIDALVERTGKAPLGIGHIADDLNLSKRTLQRRLQQHNFNFAELRDQVRFNVAVDALVRGGESIDNISTNLDFSDRTSFTNAFKRWTGLSPSVFRKFFRDYI